MSFQKPGEALGNPIRVHILKSVGALRKYEFVGMRHPVWSKKSCGSGVVLQQTTQALFAENRLAGRRCVNRSREEQ
jgi:hypothetical protein